MDEKMKINIFINGFTTSLKIDPKEEHLYREAKKLLNQRIEAYVKTFHTVDRAYTDILNMVAYEFAVEYVKLRENKQVEPQVKIDRLKELLEGINIDEDYE